MCNVCGCLSTDEAPIWQKLPCFPSSLCKMIVNCFRLVAISFNYKFPECNAPFFPIEVMFVCCIIFISCATSFFKLTHDALKIMESSFRHGLAARQLHHTFTLALYILLSLVFSCTSESRIPFIQAFVLRNVVVFICL